MSMSFALEFGQEWLRSKNGWKENECQVTPKAEPVYNSGRFFVGLDDLGVETGNEQTDSLKEILNLVIGIWRRPEHLNMKDQRGKLKMPNDMYLMGSWTLYELERVIVLPQYGGLHANYLFTQGLNSRYNLPDEINGASFIKPLFFKGRTGMEQIGYSDDGSPTPQLWYGYKLRFRGLDREQKLRRTTDAQG